MPLILPELPVSHILPDLGATLAKNTRAILSAPPGAGKTTLVPLFLLDAAWAKGKKIILLEPRRLAARAAAARMASLIGEQVGETVGYRMRLDTRISTKTRIEVVTEGVFARLILDDPELTGIAAVLFDEFHERSLDADFGLALALDAQSGLRDDLRILVMSATLDVEKIAATLGEPPIIESMGRSYPIEIRYEDRSGSERIEDVMARAILETHQHEDGSILAFLPGQAEILRTAERLQGRLPAETIIAPLYGNLSQAEQDAAIKPTRGTIRKIVLATSIAETSITIDGVRVVIDSGLQRLPVFEPATGITRLETVRVSRASADQRAGRAGRTEAGIAIRLWHAGQTASLPAFTPPQIFTSDLSGMVLDLAHWGVNDPAKLNFVDPPPAASIIEAQQLLQALGTLDAKGALTARGQLVRSLALPPRLASMIVAANEEGNAKDASMLAVLLTEQGLGGNSIDLEDRLRRFKSDRSARADASRKLADRIAQTLPKTKPSSGPLQPGVILLHAFPDRIAFQRGGRGRFVMANGRGAELEQTESLAGTPMLVIADLTGQAQKSRILAAAEVSRSDVELALPGAILSEEQCVFDKTSKQVRARKVTRLGAIILDETPLPRPTGEKAAMALAEGLRELGLNALEFSKETKQLRDRIGFLHQSVGDPWPAMSDEDLLLRLEDWFIPFQMQTRGLTEITQASLQEGLMGLIPQGVQRDLNRLAPTHFEAPTGQRHPIRYDGEEPVLAIRVQELFGLRVHPVIGGGKLPLLLELNSPAHRLIQTTRDLPGFWSGSWKDVRSDMRGRYPRHPWPDNPADALPTTRAKPRGT